LSEELIVVGHREARTENGSIQVGDWEEALKVVVMEDGKSSELYPANLGMLYHYEGRECGELNECSRLTGHWQRRR
jgi:hypothetical protein